MSQKSFLPQLAKSVSMPPIPDTLSTSEGRVDVAGRIDSGTKEFVFTWRESGGPPVAIPMKRGFGTVILRQMAEQLAGRVIMDFPPEGLSYSLHVDLAEIEARAVPSDRERAR
jgi:two-component sensor histidine kinase